MTDSQTAWERYDAIANEASTTPWRGHGTSRRYVPDFDRLERLLAVPVDLHLTSQSGLPAKAVDVWISSELRRAGFCSDQVWPRPARPRVLPREVALLIDALPSALAEDLSNRLRAGKAGRAVSADASILGRAYTKQVDVVISQWARGPELLISTKRMDSSLANNAFNRIEESYGDAHNLRGRHPLAAIGYVLVIRGSALKQTPAAAERLIDLVAKLGSDEGGYDATCVIVADWNDPIELASQAEVVVDAEAVPSRLRAGVFMETMIDAVLTRTPIDVHVRPRELKRGSPLSVGEDR